MVASNGVLYFPIVYVTIATYYVSASLGIDIFLIGEVEMMRILSMKGIC